MPGANANFRNTAQGTLSTFDGSADHDGSGNIQFSTPRLEPFMTLACGTTTSWDLVPAVGFSFYRTEDFVENRRYNARQGNFEIDTAGPIDITVTAVGFTPFLALVRSNGYALFSTDGSGVLSAMIPNDQTGPFTLEVTSLEPYATGEFSVQISCTSSTFPTVTTADSLLNGISMGCIVVHDVVAYKATVTSLHPGTPTGNVIFSDSSGTLGTAALVAGVATLPVSTQPTGPHTVTAAYQGDSTFTASSGTVSVNIVNSGDTCGGVVRWPAGPLQIDPGLVAWFHTNLDSTGATGSGLCSKTTTDPADPYWGYGVPPFGSIYVALFSGGIFGGTRVFRVNLISHGGGISCMFERISDDPKGVYVAGSPFIVLPGPYGIGSTITVT